MNLSEYPAAIETAALKHQELADEASNVRNYMGEIEDAIAARVAAAKDGSGKPLYSNETTRKAQIASELKVNEAYQNQLALIGGIERDLGQAGAKLERLRGEFAVAKIESNKQIVGALSTSAFTA